MFHTGFGKSVKAFVASALLITTFGIGSVSAQAAPQANYYPGAVYTLTNSAAGNEVVEFDRAANGDLSPAGSYATGGLGSGNGLGSQGAVVLSRANKWLFAVNAGSNEISSLSVDPIGLTLTDKVPSGGVRPISLTTYKDLLYVLNAGGSGNITGFYVGGDGHLTPIPGSTQPLSGGATGPAQVQFSGDGRLLAVTEKATNQIDIYTVNKSGVASAPITYPSSGTTPFGFAFGKGGKLVISEAFGGAPNASATSSYIVNPDGSISTVSASSPTHQTAACWLVLTNNERFAYTANAGSDTLSGYSVAPDGTLSLLDPTGVSASTGAGSHPTDLALSNNSRFVYSLNTFTHAITGFAVNSDGSLTPAGSISGLVSTAVGLAAR